MCKYRIYFLSSGARIESGLDYEGPTDEAAMQHASDLSPVGQQTEVWVGTRRIGVVEGSAPPGHPSAAATRRGRTGGRGCRSVRRWEASTPS